MSSATIASFDQFKNENGSYTIDVDKFREIIKSGGKMKRPMSGYFLWLNKERESIKEKYFSDYDTIQEWNHENLVNYFSEKGIGEPKKEGKPRIVSLITMKAGKIWKGMSDEEKEPFLSEAKCLKKEYNELKQIAENYKESVKKESVKKESVKKESVKKEGENGENENNDNEDTEEMEVEEYTYKGEVYYFNKVKGDFYDPESGDKVAKMIDGKFTFI